MSGSTDRQTERVRLLDRDREPRTRQSAEESAGAAAEVHAEMPVGLSFAESPEMPMEPLVHVIIKRLSVVSEEEQAETSEEEPDVKPVEKHTGGLRSFSLRQKLLLLGMGGANLLAGCVIALMIPFFPLEAARRGVSETLTGAVFSCFALTQLLVYPLMGRLVPRFGASRVLSAGLATAGVSTVAFGALQHIGDTRVFIAACFVTRMVEAVGTAALNTSAYTIVAQRFPQRPGVALGVLETMTGVGVSLGPAVGGGIYQLAGYGAPFYTLGAVILLWAAVAGRLLPDGGELVLTTADFWGLLRAFVASAELLLCCAVLLTISMNWTTIDPGIEPYVFRVLHIGPAQLGLYFLVATGTFCVFGMFWGWLSDRVSNTYIMLAGCLTGAACGLLMIPPSPILHLSPSWWLFGVGITTKEVFQGGAFVPLFGKILSVCVSQGMENDIVTHSFIASIFFTVFSVGNALGPTLGGVVNDAFGFPLMVTLLAGWTLFVATLAAAAALYSRWGQPQDYQQLPEEHEATSCTDAVSSSILSAVP